MIKANIAADIPSAYEFLLIDCTRIYYMVYYYLTFTSQIASLFNSSFISQFTMNMSQRNRPNRAVSILHGVVQSYRSWFSDSQAVLQNLNIIIPTGHNHFYIPPDTSLPYIKQNLTLLKLTMQMIELQVIELQLFGCYS